MAFELRINMIETVLEQRLCGDTLDRVKGIKGQQAGEHRGRAFLVVRVCDSEV